MKLILIASFVALCCASSLYKGGKNITVGEDGSINISTAEGKRVVLNRSVGLNGQRILEIYVSDPNFPSKLIQVNDDSEIGTGYSGETTWKRSLGKDAKTQGDVLVEILREYQGLVDEVTFEKLLVRIEKAVKKGLISLQVYQILNALDQADFEVLIGQIYGQQIVGGPVGGQWYNSGVYGGRFVNPWVRRYINQYIYGLNGGSQYNQYPLWQGVQGQWGINQYQQVPQYVQQVPQELENQLIQQEIQQQQWPVYGGIYGQQVQQQLENEVQQEVQQELWQQQLRGQVQGLGPYYGQQQGLTGGVYGYGNGIGYGRIVPSGVLGQSLFRDYLFGRQQYPYYGQKQIVGGLRQVLGLNGVLPLGQVQQQQPYVLQNERVVLGNNIPQVVY